MNNKKCKTKTSVADLIKPNKMYGTSDPSVTSVNDLIKPQKKHSYETSKTSKEASVTDLIKPIKPKKKHLYKTSEPPVTFVPPVTSVNDLIKPPKKYFYTCDCDCCNGVEVDSRTQKKHLKESLWKSDIARKNQENAIMVRKQKRSSINIYTTEVNSEILKK
jgi:hypothetical protein